MSRFPSSSVSNAFSRHAFLKRCQENILATYFDHDKSHLFILLGKYVQSSDLFKRCEQRLTANEPITEDEFAILMEDLCHSLHEDDHYYLIQSIGKAFCQTYRPRIIESELPVNLSASSSDLDTDSDSDETIPDLESVTEITEPVTDLSTVNEEKDPVKENDRLRAFALFHNAQRILNELPPFPCFDKDEDKKEEITSTLKAQKMYSNLTDILVHRFFGQTNTPSEEDLDRVTKQFSTFLLQIDGIVAGGAALWMVHPFEDLESDLDIWLPDSEGLRRKSNELSDWTDYRNECYENREHMVLECYITQFMSIHGYERDKNHQQDYLYRAGLDTNYNFQYVNTVLMFERKNGANVQFIFTNIRPVDMVQKFDLSICQTYWTGSEVMAFYPYHIEQRKYINHCPKDSNQEKREAKYNRRGFHPF